MDGWQYHYIGFESQTKKSMVLILEVSLERHRRTII